MPFAGSVSVSTCFPGVAGMTMGVRPTGFLSRATSTAGSVTSSSPVVMKSPFGRLSAPGTFAEAAAAGAVAAGAVATGAGEGAGAGAGAGARSTAGATDGAVVVDAGRVVPVGGRAACSWPGGTISIGLGTACRVCTQNATPRAPATATPKNSGSLERQSNRGASSSASSRAAMGMVGDSEAFGGWAAHARACAASAASSTCFRAARGESWAGKWCSRSSESCAGVASGASAWSTASRKASAVLCRSEARLAVAFLRRSWTAEGSPSSGSGEVITAWSKSVSLSQGIRPVRHS